MAQRVKNRTSLQIDIPTETKLELEDIRELYQLNDPYGRISLTKVIMILAHEKHKYYIQQGLLKVSGEVNKKTVISRKETKKNLQNKAKNNDFDNEIAPITIEAINNEREHEEDWRKEAQRELEEWRESIK